ncbi:MAG: PAS domain-containing sensor histidine kinase [Ignavibacteria bacterium]|jgi:PAS domain S-box-containing protein
MVSENIKNIEAEISKYFQDQYLLKVLMENTPDSIYFKDLECRFIKVSKGTLQKFNADNEKELIGKRDSDFFEPEHADDAKSDELEIIRTGKPLVNKVELETWCDGRRTWVTTSKLPLRDNEGNIIGTFGLTRDITELKKAENKIKKYIGELEFNKALVEEKAIELEKLNDKLSKSETKLKETNANKDKFFSIISHDLRSPFSSLLGFTDFLKNEVNNMDMDEIKQYVETISKAAQGIYKLLDNLLQWSSLQTGRLEYNPQKLDIEELIISIISLYNNKASEKGIKLSTEINGFTLAFADNNMIDTVIRNLLNNSIKFTRKCGCITLRTQSNNKEIIVSVCDTGVGMCALDLKKLFKISEHLSHVGTANESGTGLGLILCKEFIEKNGGKIWVKSEEGKGSIFSFSLPKFKEI